MAVVLGYSAYYHDSSAALVKDGKLVAAVVEERLSRIKHDASFPHLSIQFCLDHAGVSLTEVDEVVFFEKPFTKFDRILETYIKRSPKAFLPFRKFITSWLKEKFWVEDQFRKTFHTNAPFSYYRHHLSHVATTVYTENIESAAFVVIDGVGERACTSFGTVRNGRIDVLGEQHFPHSIGLLYSAFTQYCGFKVNSGEYKLMGLAPYGKPLYKDLILEHFVQINEQAEIELNTDYVGFLDGLSMINRKFQLIFGKEQRNPADPMDPFFMDVAASIQMVTEELVLKVLQYVQEKTGEQMLIYGGGVALNCVANAKILEGTAFTEVCIHSAAGDSGCAIGAALWKAHVSGDSIQPQASAYTCPQYEDTEIRLVLEGRNIYYTHFPDENELLAVVAKELADNRVVGWFQGAMELGPRALGNRSILANPRSEEMKALLNEKIKKREGFRPFAPVVMDAFFTDYFVDKGYDYSQMLYTAHTTERASEIPACVHVDGSSRVQRLTQENNPMLYALLEQFRQQTGCPVLINTSLNERGEPMVCSPEDALQCFLNTGMDVLVVGRFLIDKTENDRAVRHFKKRVYALD